MLNKLRQLEQNATLLEPSSDAREEMTPLAVDYAETFLNQLAGINTL